MAQFRDSLQINAAKTTQEFPKTNMAEFGESKLSPGL